MLTKGLLAAGAKERILQGVNTNVLHGVAFVIRQFPILAFLAPVATQKPAVLLHNYGIEQLHSGGCF